MEQQAIDALKQIEHKLDHLNNIEGLLQRIVKQLDELTKNSQFPPKA